MVHLALLVALSSLATHIYANSIDTKGSVDSVVDGPKLPLTPASLQNDIQLSELQSLSRKFQEIADSSNGTREYSSPGYNLSVDFIVATAEAAGYDVTRHPYSYQYSKTLVERLDVDEFVRFSALEHSPSTPPGGLTRPLLNVVNGIGNEDCPGRDYSNAKDSLVLIKIEKCPLAVEVMNAKAAGVAGVIAYAHWSSPPLKLETPNDTAYVPVGEITYYSSGILRKRFAQGESITATLEIQVHREMRHTTSVVASSKAGNQSNVVFVGTHLDPNTEGPAMNENASGSVAVLTLALQLAKYNLTNAVRFAWWTAGPEILSASKDFYNSLSEAERKKIALYINLDVLASPTDVYGVFDGDGSADESGSSNPPGSGAIEKVFVDYFRSKNLKTVEIPISFATVGISTPVGGLFSDVDDIKPTREAVRLGGTANREHDPNWNADADTYENLDWSTFPINTKAAAHTLATFIQSTQAIEAEKTESKRVDKLRLPE